MTFPSHLDISTPERWDATAEGLLSRLTVLVADGRFGSLTMEAVERVAAWTRLPRVRSTATADPALAHGDLTVNQVFLGDDGYRVIDWQRPVRGPSNLDIVSLLIDGKIDPAPHLDATVIELFWFLRLHWAVEAQYDLFPNGSWPLFQRWSAHAVAALHTA